MVIAMILAGGTGSRTGLERPKQFIEIGNKPILAYTVEQFQKNEEISSIEIVCHPDWEMYCGEMVTRFGLTKVRWICRGGSTFQDSVIQGIKTLERELKEKDKDVYVLIQYGAAPFTSDRIINAVLRMTKERGSAVSATPCYQLLASKEDETKSRQWADRDRYTQIACPAGFSFDYLHDIYDRAEKEKILDITDPHTTSLIYALGDTVNLAYGDQTNIKITTAEDIELFRAYAFYKEQQDIHE